VLCFGVEGEADSALARSASPARPVDIGVHFFGRFQLDDEVDFGDVEAASCHVCGNQALEFPLLEALEGDLSLFLGDVAVQHLRLLLEIGLEKDLIGFLLCLAEDDGAAVATSVKVDDIGDHGVSLEVGAVEGEVFDGFRGADF